MTRRLWPAFLLFVWAGIASAQELDLREAVRLALENNLNLQAQIHVTRATDVQVRGAYGLYDPVFGAELLAGEARGPRETAGGALNLTENRYQQFDLTLSQTLPTGARLTGFFENSRDSVSGATTPSRFDPAYSSRLGLSLAQPLLRDFGRTVTEQAILFAVRDRNIALEDLRENAFQLVAAVRNTYFDVLSARDQLAFRRTSVELAERVLRENRARVEAGVLAPVEILEAEVGLKLRQRELIEAVSAYEDALDRLTLLLNAPGQVEVSPEALEQPRIDASEEAGLQGALVKRPDILRRQQEIERLNLSHEIARNNARPALDLVGRYYHAGLGGRYGDAFEDIGSSDYRNWEVGLSFSYPIGNRAARNDVLRTQLLINSQKALLGQLRDEIRREIRAAIRELDVKSAVIDVTELGTRLARERLDTLLRRMEVGLATTRDVLEGEEDLAEARTQQIAALADYNRAVTEYLRATGQLLDHVGVRFTRDFTEEGQLLEVAVE